MTFEQRYGSRPPEGPDRDKWLDRKAVWVKAQMEMRDRAACWVELELEKRGIAEGIRALPVE